MSEDIIKELEYYEAWAQSIGWSLQYPNKANVTLADFEKERDDFEKQQKLYWQLRSLFVEELPEWVEKELRFPIDASWIDEVVYKIDFDLKWRIEWEKIKLGIHPRYYDELPPLPEFIMSDDIANSIAQLKKLRSSMQNKFWSFFNIFSSGYYKCRVEMLTRIEWYGREKSLRRKREEEYHKKERAHRMSL